MVLWIDDASVLVSRIGACRSQRPLVGAGWRPRASGSLRRRAVRNIAKPKSSVDPETDLPWTDKNSSDPARRGRPLIGVPVLYGLVPDGPGPLVGTALQHHNNSFAGQRSTRALTGRRLRHRHLRRPEYDADRVGRNSHNRTSLRIESPLAGKFRNSLVHMTPNASALTADVYLSVPTARSTLQMPPPANIMYRKTKQ
jgi:hypothetical protein